MIISAYLFILMGKNSKCNKLSYGKAPFGQEIIVIIEILLYFSVSYYDKILIHVCSHSVYLLSCVELNKICR